jgi:hypothetical protein
MSKQFWIFFGIGVVAVVIAASMTWETTKGAHLELDAKILHVRTVPASPKATIVVVDFRETNPSDVSFEVKNIEMKLDGVTDEPGAIISKADLNNIFEYMKVIGPRFNDPQSMGDIVRPHTNVDRMVAARFEVSEQAVESRKAVRIRIEDMDRTTVEMVEKKY